MLLNQFILVILTHLNSLEQLPQLTLHELHPLLIILCISLHYPTLTFRATIDLISNRLVWYFSFKYSISFRSALSSTFFQISFQIAPYSCLISRNFTQIYFLRLLVKLLLKGSERSLFTIYFMSQTSRYSLISLCSLILEPSQINFRGIQSAVSAMDFIFTFILSILFSSSVNFPFTCCNISLLTLPSFNLFTCYLSSILGRNPLPSGIPIENFISLISSSIFFTRLSITSILLMIFSLEPLSLILTSLVILSPLVLSLRSSLSSMISFSQMMWASFSFQQILLMLRQRYFRAAVTLQWFFQNFRRMSLDRLVSYFWSVYCFRSWVDIWDASTFIYSYCFYDGSAHQSEDSFSLLPSLGSDAPSSPPLSSPCFSTLFTDSDGFLLYSNLIPPLLFIFSFFSIASNLF